MAPTFVVVQANLAFAYDRQGRSDEAIAAYRKVLELEPGNVLARNNLGNLLSRNGLYGDAMREFEELLRRDPANATAKGNLETAKRNVALTQERRDAIASAVKASEARPADPGAAYNTARLYALYGDHDNALAWLATALELGYEQKDFLSVDPSLASLRKDPRFAKFLEDRGIQRAQPR
jgi:superkiller protein 3